MHKQTQDKHTKRNAKSRYAPIMRSHGGDRGRDCPSVTAHPPSYEAPKHTEASSPVCRVSRITHRASREPEHI